ncbi:MAG: cytidine deaminase [Pyrinomonadaceae bacterium]
MEENQSELIEAASAARRRAFAPYSNFKVGAAVRASSGKIYSGCNVESASFGLTVCAERVAVWKAVSEGETGFLEIAVVTDTMGLTPPCGVCRQIVWEFCGDVPVIMANCKGDAEVLPMSELLPRAFDTKFLE